MLTAIVTATALSQGALPTVTLKKIRTYENLRALVYAAAPVGSRVAASVEGNLIEVLDAASGRKLLELKGHPQPVYALAFSSDGARIATGDESARIWVWDAKTGRKIKELPRTNGHIRGILGLSFSPDGKELASAGRDDVIKVWNIGTGKLVKTLLGNGMNFYSSSFVPGGTIFASATLSGGGVRLYRTKDFTPLTTLFGHGSQGAMDVAFSKDGTRALSAGRDGTALLWDMKTRKRLQTLRGHEDWVIRAAMAPNGRVAATSSNDRSVIVWDLKAMKPAAKLIDQSTVGAPLVFTGDGKYLVTASISDAIQVYAISPAQAATTQKQPANKSRRSGSRRR